MNCQTIAPPERLTAPSGLAAPARLATGRALAATPSSAQKIAGPPRPFRISTPAIDRFPIQVWTRLASRRLKTVTLAQLDYGDPAGLLPLREAIADHVCRARGTSCVADQVIVVSMPSTRARARLPIAARSWRRRVDGGTRYPGARGALVAAGARIRPIPVDAQGLNVEAVAAGGKCAARLRDAIAPVSARRAHEPAAAAGAPGLGTGARARGSSRTTTTASSASAVRAPFPAC